MSNTILQFVSAFIRHERSNAKAQKFANAAWQFAHCLLWSEQKFSSDEIDKVKFYLKKFYCRQSDPSRALITFCERILFQQLCLRGKEQEQKPMPAYWFSPLNPKGFNATDALYKNVQEQRIINPAFFRHFWTMAHFYNRYSKNPSDFLFHKYRRRLIALKANTLLGYFYALVSHIQHNNVSPL